jgi:hypothetical protein
VPPGTQRPPHSVRARLTSDLAAPSIAQSVIWPDETQSIRYFHDATHSLRAAAPADLSSTNADSCGRAPRDPPAFDDVHLKM